MKLLEHRGKELLRSSGIRVPAGIVTDNKDYINLSHHKERYKEFFHEHRSVVIKAQVVGTDRRKAGLIITADDYAESLKAIAALYDKEWNGVPVDTLLIEKRLDVAEEHYLCVLYDTRTRRPSIVLSRRGGTGVEDAAEPATLTVSPVEGLHEYQARALAREAGFVGDDVFSIALLVQRAYKCFWEHDCRILEINPVIRTTNGVLYAADAKVTVDDSGIARQAAFHDVTDAEDLSLLTPRALEARRIDYRDHRGVAGKTFVELDGDIAVLASGGGASLTAMDALIEAGGRPANYTEYSGNPPREKVRRLTEITLSKPGLKGCFLVGGTANFTDIAETLRGFLEGLAATTPKPAYPIIIRRWGPKAEKAFAEVQAFAEEHGYDITLYGEDIPLSEAAKRMAEAAR